ncbi:hypothetical protein [Marinilabilia sp.]
MKKLMLVILTMTICLAGFAQKQERRRPLPADNDQQIEKMKENLVLSDEQIVNVSSILEKRSEALKNLKEEDGTREEKRKQIREISESYDKKIKAELTEEQSVKYDKMMKEERQKPMRRRRQN